MSRFSTGGETIYHLRGAQTRAATGRSIIAAAYSGKVLCFDFSGRQQWAQAANLCFPFSLDAGDLDGDGFDECVVASADGSLYIIEPDGRLRAKVFTGKPPLYSVKIVTWNNGRAGIICGGPERILYHVSPQGQVVSSVAMPGAISAIDLGRLAPSEPASVVVKLSLDFNRVQLSRHRLPGLEPQEAPRALNERFLYNLITLDTDGDGRDEIAMGGAKGGVLYDASGQRILNLQERGTGRGQHVYAMVMLDKRPAKTGRGHELVGVYASTLRLYGADGKIRQEVPLPDSPAGLCYDAASHTLLLGSGISGDDCIYRVDLDQPGWADALKQVGFQGKLRQIAANLETLADQIATFQPPAYQPRATPDALCVFAVEPFSAGTVAELTPAHSLAPLTRLHQREFPYPHLSFAGNQWLSEDWDRSQLPHGWAGTRDPRMKYQLTQQEIVAHAGRLEREGLPFVWTIGHGNDPFFLSLATIEAILRAAPTACRGFIFPEVARDDTPAYRYAVAAHVKPVADLCLKYGQRKVFLRSKFLFWSADCTTDMWNWMVADRKYRDVIVPAMEETYERLGDLSLSGRVGLWLGGWVADWAGRAVQDNVCYDREHQWAATMVGSHFLRALCYQAGLGARYHLIQLSEARSGEGGPQFRDHGLMVVKPFLHMLGKGILPRPTSPAAMLALSPVALAMRPPSPTFMAASHNSHQIAKYRADPPWVFSRLEGFWGQAPTPHYDFGYYGIGRRRQALNFLPTFPHGFVAIVPDPARIADLPGISSLRITDGESWFDDAGQCHAAIDYAPQVEETLRAASAQLFVHVRGQVAWTATRLDPDHVRLVLIDAGYLDPADRTAEVVVRAEVVSATDILSRQTLAVRQNALTVTVPMGILRVIDFEHR